MSLYFGTSQVREEEMRMMYYEEKIDCTQPLMINYREVVL